MTRPAFNAVLIADLKARVASHNEAAPEAFKVKLGDLKRIYERGFRGEQPGERALRKVDDHLADLAKAFDPSKHPRRKDGKFGTEDDAGSALDAVAGHARRAAGAAADAASATGAGVKRALHHAAYIHGLADGPPLPEGIKIPKAPLNLPADKQQHQALQQVNAGYSAFTSDVIPEKRFEAIGDLARSAVGLTGGALIAHMLASKNTNNATRRAFETALSYPVGKIAAVTYSTPVHVVGVAYEMAHRKLGSKGDPVKVRRFAYNSASQVDRAVRSVARGAVSRGVDAARFGVGKFLDTVEGLPSEFEKAPEPVKMSDFKSWAGARAAAARLNRAIIVHGTRPARRAGGVAALIALPALAIDKAISDSGVDPGKAGAAYDNLTYRIVNKVLDLPETGALTKALRADLRKAAAFDGLDTGVERLFSRTSGAAITGLSSAFGGAVGAATGAAGAVAHEAVSNALNGGNPYHDSKGRFTSKEDAEQPSQVGQAALAGAVAGAALGGGLAHMQLRAFNQRVFREAMKHLDNHVRNLTEAPTAAAESSIIPEVKALSDKLRSKLVEMNADKEGYVKDAVKTDKGVMGVQEEVDKFGASSPSHYKAVLRQQINDYLAKMNVQFDTFHLPDKTGALIPMPQIRARYARFLDHARNAIDGATPEMFEKMIAKMSPAQQEAARHIFAKRAEISDHVDAALAGHTKKIEDAMAAVAAKSEALDKAQASLDDAGAVWNMKTQAGPERDAAQAAVEGARKVAEAAEKSAIAAQKKLDKLRLEGPEVRSALDNQLLPPASESSMREIYNRAVAKATLSAEHAHGKLVEKEKKKFAAEMQRARDDYAADLRVRHARQVGAFVALGRRAAGLGNITGRNVDQLVAAHADHAVALGKLESAMSRQSAARGLLNQLLDEKETRFPGGRGSKTERAALTANIAARQADVAQTKAEYEAAFDEANAKQAALLVHAEDFLNKYNKFREDSQKSGTFAFMPPALVAEMTRDVHRAFMAGYSPVDEYAIQPSAAGLRRVLDYVSPRARVMGASVARGAEKTFKGSFMRQATDVDPVTGATSTYWVPDPLKILFWSATGVGAATIDFLRDYKNYAHNQVFGDGKMKSPTNLQVELRRHPTKENEGMFAVHAADPRNKSERLIVFGHRYEEGKAEPINLNPGARLSDVQNQFQNRQDGNRASGDRGDAAPADAGWLSQKAKADIDAQLKKIVEEKDDKKKVGLRLQGFGVSFWARKKDDSDQANNNAAGTFMSEFNNQFAKGKPQENADTFYKALGALFSKQSSILRPNQFYQLLTGYRGSEKKGDGILTPNENYGGEPEEAKGAIQAELARIVEKMPPRNPQEANLLRKVILVAGESKKISAPDLDAVYGETVGKAEREMPPVAERVTRESGPGTSVVAYKTPPIKPAIPDHIGDALRAPTDFDNPYSDQAELVAGNIAPLLGLKTDTERDLLSGMIAHYIKAVAKAQDFDIPTAGKVVADAMVRLGGGDRTTQAQFKAMMQQTDYAGFERALNQAVRRHKHEQRAEAGVEKADFVIRGGDLDSLEIMLKRMPASAASATNVGTAPPGPTPGKPPRYTMTDAIAAAGDLAGAGVANEALNHVGFLKTPNLGTADVLRGIATPVKTAGAAVGAVKTAFQGGAGAGFRSLGGTAATGLKLGAKGLLAGAAGAGLYNLIQAAGHGPSYARNTSTGETLAMGATKFGGATLGEMAGGALGAAGGPVGVVAGEIAGGAAGAALGDFLGHKAFKAFSGYDSGAVNRIMKTKLQAAPPDQAGLVQAGEVGGGVVGNALAGAKGEGLFSAIGAAAGAADARAGGAVDSLRGRPKQAATGVP